MLVVHVYSLSAISQDTIMEKQIPYQAQLSGWRPVAWRLRAGLCDGAMQANWEEVRVDVRMGKRSSFLGLAERTPNCITSALLRRQWGLFSSALVLLDWRWRSTHSGLLMRKAQRTQKFSRHYSLTFVRFAGDATARRSCSRGAAHASGSPGPRSGTRSNTREPRYACNIKTNQPPSATPHLGPPLRAAGWACGGNESAVMLGPHRHLHCETLTTTGAPGTSVRQAARKRVKWGKRSVRETRQST